MRSHKLIFWKKSNRPQFFSLSDKLMVLVTIQNIKWLSMWKKRGPYVVQIESKLIIFDHWSHVKLHIFVAFLPQKIVSWSADIICWEGLNFLISSSTKIIISCLGLKFISLFTFINWRVWKHIKLCWEHFKSSLEHINSCCEDRNSS